MRNRILIRHVKGQRLKINNDYRYITFVSSLKDSFIKDNFHKDKYTEL